jgi:hypothetical protein
MPVVIVDWVDAPPAFHCDRQLVPDVEMDAEIDNNVCSPSFIINCSCRRNDKTCPSRQELVLQLSYTLTMRILRKDMLLSDRSIECQSEALSWRTRMRLR